MSLWQNLNISSMRLTCLYINLFRIKKPHLSNSHTTTHTHTRTHRCNVGSRCHFSVPDQSAAENNGNQSNRTHAQVRTEKARQTPRIVQGKPARHTPVKGDAKRSLGGTAPCPILYLDTPMCLVMVSHWEQLSPKVALKGGYVNSTVWKET